MNADHRNAMTSCPEREQKCAGTPKKYRSRLEKILPGQSMSRKVPATQTKIRLPATLLTQLIQGRQEPTGKVKKDQLPETKPMNAKIIIDTHSASIDENQKMATRQQDELIEPIVIHEYDSDEECEIADNFNGYTYRIEEITEACNDQDQGLTITISQNINGDNHAGANDGEVIYRVSNQRGIDCIERLENTGNEVDTRKKRHKCRVCGVEFVRSYQLNRHLFVGIHNLPTGIQPQLSPPSDAITGNYTRGEECPLCDKIIFNFHLHFETSHSLQCGHCGKYYFNEITLRTHVRLKHPVEEKTVKEQRPAQFQCDSCQMYFPTYDGIQAHLQTAHNSGKHVQNQCDVCGKTFLYRRALRNHMYDHTDLKRFRCDACVYGTNKKRKIISHYHKKHKKKAPKTITGDKLEF